MDAGGHSDVVISGYCFSLNFGRGGLFEQIENFGAHPATSECEGVVYDKRVSVDRTESYPRQAPSRPTSTNLIPALRVPPVPKTTLGLVVLLQLSKEAAGVPEPSPASSRLTASAYPSPSGLPTTPAPGETQGSKLGHTPKQTQQPVWPPGMVYTSVEQSDIFFQFLQSSRAVIQEDVQDLSCLRISTPKSPVLPFSARDEATQIDLAIRIASFLLRIEATDTSSVQPTGILRTIKLSQYPSVYPL